MNTNGLHSWLTLALTPQLGPSTIMRLISHFGDAQSVLAAPSRELHGLGIVRKEALQALADPATASLAEQEMHRAAAMDITILTWDCPAYPPLLKEIGNPPVVLFVKGSVDTLAQPGLAVIGARAASSYGLQMAESLAASLAGHKLPVISGMALGIDAAAHRGALAGGGTTVAVLGCGLDVLYPRQNRKLAEKIEERGAIVSEYPLGTQPDAFRFPARNRIISGLALGVIVVEAAKKSGTLITAQLALDQGREVFAVPGRIDSPKSEGCHFLVKNGAKLVHSTQDILEEIQYNGAMPQPAAARPAHRELSQDESQLLAALDVYAKNIEELIAETGLPASRIHELLFLLEMEGLVASLPGKQYQRLAELHRSSV